MHKIISHLILKVPVAESPQNQSSEVLTVGFKTVLTSPSQRRRSGCLAEGCPQGWSSRVWETIRKSFTSAKTGGQNTEHPGQKGLAKPAWANPSTQVPPRAS